MASSIDAALRSSLLSFLLGLDSSLAQTLDHRVLELFLLRTAQMRRRRIREMEARARRLSHYLRRRKTFVLSALAGVLSLINSTGVRGMWTKDRPVEGGEFWQAAQHFTDEEWKMQFRVTRATFSHLLQLLEPSITRKRTHIRTPIDSRRRLAITLWWFGQGGEYRRIAELFGVGSATVCVILRQVTAAIVENLYKRFVSWPSGERLDTTIKGFKDKGYPQCAGAIGTTHIPIVGPGERPKDYLNSRTWYSVILQAVVDHNLSFTHVYAGWPGRNSSATVLSSSDLFLKAEDQLDTCLFPQEKSIVCSGVEIPVHLIGDTSFPLKPWLLKGYGQDQARPLTPEQQRLTWCLNSAHSVVHSAFSRLKGRWGCLQRRNDQEVTALPSIISACCTLHNICEYLGDDFFPEWSMDGGRGTLFLQPEVEPYDGDSYSGSAEVIRHTLAYSLLDIVSDMTFTVNGFTITYND